MVGRGLMREAIWGNYAMGFQPASVVRIFALCDVENRASARRWKKAVS